MAQHLFVGCMHDVADAHVGNVHNARVFCELCRVQGWTSWRTTTLEVWVVSVVKAAWMRKASCSLMISVFGKVVLNRLRTYSRVLCFKIELSREEKRREENEVEKRRVG